MNYGYLRVSTDKQDLDNQRHAVLDYANTNHINDIIFIEDTISTKARLETRKIHELLTEQAIKGDIVVVSEVSRLGRNTLEVLELAKIAIERGINLLIAKQGIHFDDSIQNKIYLTVLGLVAEIERDFIQQRTKTALDARKAEIKEKGYFTSKAGIKRQQLGNPRGTKYKLGLEEKKEEIHRLLSLGVSKTAICKIIGTSAPTLSRFLARFPLKAQLGLDGLTNAQRVEVEKIKKS